jgi:SAM-dependent methyltransferase
MGSYLGQHAEYYDIFYQDKPYAAEAAFVHACLQQYSLGKTKRLLELACGSGNHAFALEALGYQIVASDYSSDLLAVASRKAIQRLSEVDFRLADMRELDLDDGPYDAAYCLFDSIGYVQTNQAIQQVLSGVHRHLRPGGLFIFEFWHAAAMLRGYEPRRERSWQVDGLTLKRVSKTTLDVPRQLAKVSYEIEAITTDGARTELQETQVNRYFLVQEMAAHLSSAGFEALDWLAAYDWEQPIDADTWHILAIARRGKD